jgi:hypothetical protein
MTNDEGEANELAVLIRVLDILKLRIETRELHNYEAVQVTQIINQFLPGTTIGNFIEDHSEHRGDDVVGDKYEAHGNAQIGAMGKRAKVTTVTFGDAQGQMTEVDLDSLLAELKSLRAAMRSQASTTEDDQAVVSIGQAIAAGEEGDSSTLFAYLKSAGKWALDLATSIGAELAAGVIKSVLGLK